MAEHQYDGRNFRTVLKSYSSGTLSETRHAYFSDDWRCLEERIGTATTPDRHFIWGERYIDELILRDRDIDGNGTIDERLYALQDANWNTTVVASASGAVQERYAYSGYGTPIFLTPTFGSRGSSNHAWEILFCGYGYDNATRLSQVRSRTYHSIIGMWLQRDMFAGVNLYEYLSSRPYWETDPFGLHPGVIVIGGAIITYEAAAAIAATFGVGVWGCLNNPGCRAALASAASNVNKAVNDALDEAKEWIKNFVRYCKNKKYKCNMKVDPPHHPFTKPKPTPPYFKQCWMSHVQINCYIPGTSVFDFHIRFEFGPCCKFRNCRGGVIH